ncbi:heme ABC exporter ATP-binding protein CcmA [Sphingomonas piscis]|uniref:Heme ABC exporter ATP-binding protein CcmA n=1 Tax=Sphingomonas piscis TaxID=2714943 RepID=A0A6G7YQC1_9SPHN|nr:heme ABC exporter ATP-binding protein CcmA [Sphingomonas piscis]QIK78934.1 heme ABC exporter ATP-binding protein CcmA [Sphingomonas piscis]
MTSPLLRFSDVALVRGGRLLFERLSFDLLPGGAVQVLGPNGIGKSSLIRLAAGLLTPTEGTVDAVNLALSDDKVALDRELPLGRALAFWAKGRGPDEQSAALRLFDLQGLVEVPVRLLSTGQLKRAGLARAALSSAPLWLLDEPLNGLDQDSAERLDHAVAMHRQSGGAVLAASHVPLGGAWTRLELAA